MNFINGCSTDSFSFHFLMKLIANVSSAVDAEAMFSSIVLLSLVEI